MTYQEFLSQVQESAGLASPHEAERAVRATLRVLGESLAGGDLAALPAELRAQIPEALAGPAGLPLASADETSNPQLVGEERAESGGESTAESGQ